MVHLSALPLRRVLAVGGLVLTCVALAAAHAAPPAADHMDMTAVIALCAAVTEAGLGALALALARPPVGPRAAVGVQVPRAPAFLPLVPVASARAGPARLQVFRR